MTIKYPNDPEKLAVAKKMMPHKACDNARAPIQWNYSPNAGFCPADVKPWIRDNDDYRTVNAAEQLARPSFVLSYGKVTFVSFCKVKLRTKVNSKEAELSIGDKLEEGEEDSIYSNWL